MPNPFESVVEQALSLTARDRLRLASELLQSVEPKTAKDVQLLWEREIQRRMAEVDSGTAVGRPWDEIKEDFDSRYGR